MELFEAAEDLLYSILYPPYSLTIQPDKHSFSVPLGSGLVGTDSTLDQF